MGSTAKDPKRVGCCCFIPAANSLQARASETASARESKYVPGADREVRATSMPFMSITSRDCWTVHFGRGVEATSVSPRTSMAAVKAGGIRWWWTSMRPRAGALRAIRRPPSRAVRLPG